MIYIDNRKWTPDEDWDNTEQDEESEVYEKDWDGYEYDQLTFDEYTP
jgi:hypothetical protein